MSKRIFLILIPLLLSFQKDKETISILLNENGPEILNGNVKQLTIRYGEDNDVSQDRGVITFDNLGNICKEEKVSHGNRYRTDFIVKYNNDNRRKIRILSFTKNLTKYPIGFLNKDTTTIDTSVIVNGIYECNKNGLIVKYILNADKQSGGSYFFKYNSDGYIIESDYYIQPKQLLKRLKYKYDSKHRLIESDQYTNKNVLAYRQLYSYTSFDSKNNWIKMKVHTDGFYSMPSDVQTLTVTRKITYY